MGDGDLERYASNIFEFWFGFIFLRKATSVQITQKLENFSRCRRIILKNTFGTVSADQTVLVCRETP